MQFSVRQHLDISLSRPVSGSLIAEMFSASSRGVANGVFSWGVYYGYGLAFVFGIYISSADVLGYGWRSPYVIAGLPGLLLATLTLTTFPDPRQSQEHQQDKPSAGLGGLNYLKTFLRSFCSPSMIILLVAGNFSQKLIKSYNLSIQHFSDTPRATAGLTTPGTSSSSTTQNLISELGLSVPQSSADPSGCSLEVSSPTAWSTISDCPPDYGSSPSALCSPLPSPSAHSTSHLQEPSVRPASLSSRSSSNHSQVVSFSTTSWQKLGSQSSSRLSWRLWSQR